VSATVRW